MKLNDIVKTARVANRAAFESVDDQQAVKILLAVFRQVGNQVESARDGQVVIGGLGRFTIKSVERDKDGVKVMQRRVTFRPGGARKKRRAAKQKSGSDTQ